MSLRRARAVFSVILTLTLTTTASGAPEVPPIVEPLTFEQQAQLRDFLIDTFWGRLNSIKSLDYQYAHRRSGNAMYGEGRYERDGERYRHGYVERHGDGRFCHGMESLWDGRLIHERRMDGIALWRVPAEERPVGPRPDQALLEGIRRAYGLKPQSDSRYDFVGAMESKVLGRHCIELRFKQTMQGRRFDLVIRHARDVDYWPIYIAAMNVNGRSGTEVIDVQYHKKVEEDGSAVFFPASFRQRHRSPRGVSTTSFVIDGKTLRLNEKIDESRFKMEPWPSESVQLEDGRTVPPVDPDWEPDGRVGFPMRDWMTLQHKRLQARKSVVVEPATKPAK
jgi:hypothetical protein